MDDANIKAFVSLLKEKKHSMTSINQAFTTIYGKHPRMKEVK